MSDQEATANPPKTPRGPVERMNLPLTKAATERIKAKARLYPGQQADVVIRLAKRYEELHLSADLAAIVEEKERDRRVALGLDSQAGDAPQAGPVIVNLQGD